METQIISISKIDMAIQALLLGNPIVFPTETVYGLGAPMFNQRCVEEVFLIKERSLKKPLAVLVTSIEQSLSLSCAQPASFILLASHFWPGPLTLILQCNEKISQIVSAGRLTIGVRMPDHPLVIELMQAINQPLVASSANLSGGASPTRALEALESLRGKVGLILDGGDCAVGVESTILDISGSEPVLLRPGSISQEMLEEVLCEKIVFS